jgi:hypothetical protein
VGLIKNEYFVSVSGWGKNCSLTQVSGIINTVVRSRVNFNNI